MEEEKDDTKCKLADQMDISYEMLRCNTHFSPDDYSCFSSLWQFDVRVQRCKVVVKK